ncbi:hypothetical protein [Weissella cibaria]|uniref:hypothetical protein n=1 Tax=Weissella cibaria TaxID=137591 RepID=UPI000705F10A|nr:hypothetical protein [Weissella cibaria]ALI33923.1 hypothetical protein AO080_10935 [Weissella cibaria]
MTDQELSAFIQHIRVAVSEFNDTIENEKSEEAKLLAIGTKYGMKWVADLLKKGEIDTLPTIASQRYKHTRNQVMKREYTKKKAVELSPFELGFELATKAIVEAINDSFMNTETKATMLRIINNQLSNLNQ